MKTFLLLPLFLFPVLVMPQAQDVMGIYLLRVEKENGVIQHKMALHEEGTFLFSTYFSPNNPEGKTLEITSMYGSGKWRTNGNQLFFVVDREEDFDADRILDFSKTRARIQQLAPGTINGENGTPQLVFFDSNIFWVKGLILDKQ